MGFVDVSPFPRGLFQVPGVSFLRGVNMKASWWPLFTGRGFATQLIWLVVSTDLKHISQNGNPPEVGVKIKIFETTT